MSPIQIGTFVFQVVFGQKDFDEFLVIDSILVNIYVAPSVYAFGFAADAD